MSSTAAIAISSAALAESSRAHDVACQSMMQGYTHTTATVQQAQEYASCVKRLHPDDMTPDQLIIAKVLILIILASMGIRWWTDRDSWHDWWESLILGFCIGLVIVLVLGVAGLFITVLIA